MSTITWFVFYLSIISRIIINDLIRVNRKSKKAVYKSSRKAMLTFFSDCRGLLLLEFLQQKTVGDEFLSRQCLQLSCTIQQCRMVHNYEHLPEDPHSFFCMRTKSVSVFFLTVLSNYTITCPMFPFEILKLISDTHTCGLFREILSICSL